MTKLPDYHTLQGWQFEQDYYEEYLRERAESEYFAHVEATTHDYPLATHSVPTSGILVSNELILGESPF